MKMQEFAAAMERIAPRELAAEFDNPGLLVEPDHDEIHRVLVALDCTKAVAEEAALWGADLVLTHHPLFFHPVKHMAYSDPATTAACILLLVGLATRFSAFALLGMTLVIQVFVYPGAYPTHGVWAAVLLYLLAQGPGALSVDRWIATRWIRDTR